MAKIKPARKSAAKTGTTPLGDWTKGAPCLFLLITGFLVVAFIFYAALSSSVK